MKTYQKILLVIGSIIIVLAVVVFVFRDALIQRLFQPTGSNIPEGRSMNVADIETASANLVTPWSITFLPGNDILVTQRGGELTRIGQDGQSFTIAEVEETSEGGLLGVALHPNFAQNQQLYLYQTTTQGGSLSNKVDMYRLINNDLSFVRTILQDIPAATNHNGGAIAFGPDGKLYITTGDAANTSFAQDKNSLAGKILRLNDDGSRPGDNPFENSLTWSYGHRNPQGMAWDSTGALWAVEHGQSSQDELNKIEKGGNYGWPVIRGDETRDGMIGPVVHSGNTETWAPAGLAYHDGMLYFAGLRGQALYQARITGTDSVSLTRHLSGTYGRLRAVTVHNDFLYISTSNRDGRGSPAATDDRLLKIKLSALRPTSNP